MKAFPDPAQVTRYSADVGAVAALANEQPIAVAVSGGPDSMAMLALTAAAFPGRVVAATVDHRLRAENADEAAMVANWCREQGIAHTTLVVHETRGANDNLHDWARQLRYRLLIRWAIAAGAPLLATAHHADDQAETFLMRAARGSGVAGLAGIRSNQTTGLGIPTDGPIGGPIDVSIGGPIGGSAQTFDTAPLTLIRPLLGWRSAELRAIATALCLPFVDDPSNANRQFSRTQFRELLARESLLDPMQLARSAAHSAEADSALRAIGEWFWKDRRQTSEGVENPDAEIWLDLRGLPREIKRRMSRDAISAVRTACGITDPAFSDSSNIEPLLDAVEAGSRATKAGILVSRKGDLWHFMEAPPRQSP